MASKKDKDTQEPVDQPKNDWKFSPDGSSQAASAEDAFTGQSQASSADQNNSVTWTASEYLSHEKDPAWFIGLGLAGTVLAVLIYVVTRDYISTTVVAMMTIIFGVFAGRRPQTLEYTINHDGLQIGPKHYPYAHFKSFAIMDEGAVFSIMLLPLKRFMPPISIYYDSKDEGSIVDVLSAYLPLEERSHDLTDQLMRKIRF